MADKKRVRFWRGTAKSYELLKKAGKLNYWTRYSVKYEDKNGVITWKEFYGDNPLTEEPGQLLPVIDIISQLPSVLNPGDRYWISTDSENYIVDILVGENDSTGEPTLTQRFTTLKEGISVRVREKGYKSYLIVDNEVKTYDEVDCGFYE